jgi:hypothetical protein
MAGIMCGFPAVPFGKEPEDIPPFYVENYPAPRKARRAMYALIHKDRDKGWLIKRQQKPAHITALLHHVVQKTSCGL